MLTSLIMSAANRSPTARGKIFKWTFEALAALTRNVDAWTLMNYGYADLDSGALPPALEPGDEGERYCLQLYHHAAAPVDLRDKDVVEISCGRGGGASYLKRCLGAKSVTGVDLSTNQITFCRRVHKVPGLRFVQGAAEDIPLPDDCADAVVNIEASCLYQDTDRFFDEVRRILRAGGHFVYADIHRRCDVDTLFTKLDRSGLVTAACQDITANVVRALALDHDRREAGVRQYAPFFLRGLIRSFAGTQGTRIPNGLADASLAYLSFALAKPGHEAAAGKPAQQDAKPREAVLV
jgi:SAM-dependent methyltransferase